MEGVANSNANTLLTLTHTEGAAKLYLLTKIVLSDECLKLLYYTTRAFDVTGATDTYCDFKHLFISVSFIVGIRRAPRRSSFCIYILLAKFVLNFFEIFVVLHVEAVVAYSELVGKQRKYPLTYFSKWILR